MIKMLKNQMLWIVYFLFVAIAIGTHSSEPLFFSEGPFAEGKPIAWLVWLGFLLYSLNISRQESFFKALKLMSPIKWTRQIGIDLYIGVAMFAALIFFNEGSLMPLLFWLVPLIIYANLATLLYLALNYQSIVNHFIGV